jgi:hypothetical protein
VTQQSVKRIRAATGDVLGAVFSRRSRLRAGWVRFGVVRAVAGGFAVIAEGEAPSEAEAVRLAKFLVER